MTGNDRPGKNRGGGRAALSGQEKQTAPGGGRMSGNVRFCPVGKNSLAPPWRGWSPDGPAPGGKLLDAPRPGADNRPPNADNRDNPPTRKGRCDATSPIPPGVRLLGRGRR